MTRRDRISGRMVDLDWLSGRYDAFLIDQFGVLHDGIAAYPGAVEALDRLKRRGRRIALLSNSGKRTSANEDRLVRLGFSRGSWDLMMTSGEVAWRILAGQADAPRLRRGTRCLYFSRDGDTTAIEGLDLDLVEDAGRAELVLITGSRGDTWTLDDYREWLAPAAAAGAACICTNPDRIMLTASGPAFGAGRIGELYQELGGTVRWIGKPHGDIYALTLGALDAPSRSNVVCLGDSVEHDIAGARGAGLDSVLVRSGICAGLNEAALEQVFDDFGVVPDLILARFAPPEA